MTLVIPEEYYADLNFDTNWFNEACPAQIMNLINLEKDDLHSREFNKNDCHTILVFLKKKYRESKKREKTKKKNFKKGIGFITISSKKSQNNECSICFEKPQFNDLITTECKHHFCRICFDRWAASNLNTSFDITCPNCRKTNPVTKQYKYKLKR